MDSSSYLRLHFMCDIAVRNPYCTRNQAKYIIMDNFDVKNHNILVQFYKFLCLTQIHDISEMLFKVVLNTINLSKSDVSHDL